MPVTAALVAGFIAAISPGAQSHVFAQAIAQAVSRPTPPVFESREVDAAVLVVTGWEEARLTLNAKRGDLDIHANGSCSTFQIRARSASQCVALERDPAYSSFYAYWLVRESARLCPGHDAELAPYAGSCTGATPRRISSHRLDLARRIARDVTRELGSEFSR
jgi:hypothetical protein